MNTKGKNLSTNENSFLYKMISEKGFFYFILTFILALPICEFITQCFGIPFVSQPLIVTFYGCLGIIMIVIKLLMRDKQHFVVYPSDIFFILLILFATISLIFSCNLQRSLNGYDYDELIYHFLAYYSLMYAGTMVQDKRFRKIIIYTFVIIAAFHSFIALSQTWGWELTYMYFSPVEFEREHGVYGLTQNKNWFGGLSVLFTGASAGCYLFYKDSKKRYLFLLISALCIYTSMCCKSRLTWIGIFCIIIMYIISFIIMHKKYNLSTISRRFCALLLVFMFCICLSEVCYGAISHNISRSQTAQSNGGLNALSNNRLYIWRYGLESVPKHWLTGIGLDNYAEAFFENPKWSSPMFYQDKGHNEYIHTLVTQGVFAVINYILMLIYACIIGIKVVIHTEDDEERRITWILLGMFIGYATQAFFNSSVINVAPYFWIVVGMTMPKKHQKPILKKQKNEAPQS